MRTRQTDYAFTARPLSGVPYEEKPKSVNLASIFR